MYYLPLLYVPYKAGDENVIFDPGVTGTQNVLISEGIQTNIFPNPSSRLSNFPVHIEFELKRGMPLNIDIFDSNGKLLRVLKDNEYFSQGKHVIHLQANHLNVGMHIIQIQGVQVKTSFPLLITE